MTADGSATGAQLYRAVFEASPLGMAVVSMGRSGRAVILDVNDALPAVLRCSRSQLIGRSLQELLGPVLLDGHPRPVALAVERPMMLSTGEEIWTRWHLTELPAGQGPDECLLAQAEDVTEQRAASDQARRRARMLELIPEPVIVRSLDGTIRYWNNGAADVYGYRSADALGRRTHDLLATQFEGWTLAELEDTLATVGAWNGRVRHRHADGRLLHIASRHVRDENADGEPVILEINIDVTERVAFENALSASEAKFRAQFEHSTVGQLIRRPDGMIEDVNPALAAMLAYRAEDLIGTHADRLFPPGVTNERRRVVDALASGAGSAAHGEGALVRSDGEFLDVEMHVSLARDVEGQVAHVIGIFQDISGRKSAEDALRHQAWHDALTGLGNRMLLERELDELLSRRADGDRGLGLLVIDLDGFKSVNDLYGHQTGDQVLIEVARRLTAAVRGADTVIRMGGDEFVVVCPDLEQASDLQHVASRIRTHLAMPYELTGAVVTTLTASIGVASAVRHSTVTEMLRQADSAMYSAKHRGKNALHTFVADTP